MDFMDFIDFIDFIDFCVITLAALLKLGLSMVHICMMELAYCILNLLISSLI